MDEVTGQITSNVSWPNTERSYNIVKKKKKKKKILTCVNAILLQWNSNIVNIQHMIS
jgi:hypothetical protein